jgi:hypothetical protein
VKHILRNRQVWKTIVLSGVGAFILFSAGNGGAEIKADTKGEKTFDTAVTDIQGVETEMKSLHFYWEEKVSETAFIPHELKQIPVKRGSATVNIKFDTIKQIDIKPASDKNFPTFTITLHNGKTGEFVLAIAGSFKGNSDFGGVEVPASGIKKILFK